MKKVEIVYYMEDFITGEVERDVEIGYLIAPGIAVTTCISSLYFNRVKPSVDGSGLYDDCGVISTIDLPDSNVDVTTMPREALTFALWAAGETLESFATAV